MLPATGGGAVLPSTDRAAEAPAGAVGATGAVLLNAGVAGGEDFPSIPKAEETLELAAGPCGSVSVGGPGNTDFATATVGGPGSTGFATSPVGGRGNTAFATATAEAGAAAATAGALPPSKLSAALAPVPVLGAGAAPLAEPPNKAQAAAAMGHRLCRADFELCIHRSTRYNELFQRQQGHPLSCNMEVGLLDDVGMNLGLGQQYVIMSKPKQVQWVTETSLIEEVCMSDMFEFMQNSWCILAFCPLGYGL